MRTAPDEARLTRLDCAQEAGFSSAQTIEVTSVQFYNERSEAIAVHWLDFDGNRQPWTTLQPRTKVKLQTSDPGAAVVEG